jgi:hypothetical protein
MFGSDLTDTQDCIVRTYDRNPDITPKGIADACDCSESYVRQTLNDHRPQWNNDDGIGLF